MIFLILIQSSCLKKYFSQVLLKNLRDNALPECFLGVKDLLINLLSCNLQSSAANPSRPSFGLLLGDLQRPELFLYGCRTPQAALRTTRSHDIYIYKTLRQHHALNFLFGLSNMHINGVLSHAKFSSHEAVHLRNKHKGRMLRRQRVVLVFKEAERYENSKRISHSARGCRTLK